MKLRGKLQLAIGGLAAIMLLSLGILSAQLNYTSILKNVDDSISTSTGLASHEISALLESYSKITSVTGTDGILASDASDAIKVARIDELAAEYGFTSGNILDKTGLSLNDGTDFSERDYVIRALAGETNISDINLSKYTNTYGFSVAAPVIIGGEVEGVVYYRMDVDFMDEILSSINISPNSYAYLVDSDNNIIVHPDRDKIGTVSAASAGAGAYTIDGVPVRCGYAPVKNSNGWSVVIVCPEKDFESQLQGAVRKIILSVIGSIIFALIVTAFIAQSLSGKIDKVKDTLVKISEGDFSADMHSSNSKDELGILNNAAYSLNKTLKSVVSDTNRVLTAMADYDLTSRDMENYPGDFNEIAVSVNNINSILKGLIAEVKESAKSVGVGAKELADAAENLSRGTVAQASSIQTVVSDADVMLECVKNTGATGEQANAQLKVLDGQIHVGNDEMVTLLEGVKEIEEMSNDIQKIVGTIDSIAFQTNILALNAAVEAASAGEHGKGFAVVADEIGNLASKCSESSKQTEELLNRCIDRIRKAKASADVTFDCLSVVVKSSGEISTAFDQITTDAIALATSASNVHKEVNIISDVIQNNTAAAEESAAASETLSEQAMNLNELIRQFRV